jgi:hypothetical protein
MLNNAFLAFFNRLLVYPVKQSVTYRRLADPG